ncbi:MAG: hypothetical protein EBY21_00285 [Alphaproteobacteria bacterium]|nr:hypothetical protein [Alphaproteobacteria bacterium]
MTSLLRTWLWVGLACLANWQQAAAQDWRACAGSAEEFGQSQDIKVQEVTPDGELLLQDGRLVLLAGLVPLALLPNSRAKGEQLRLALQGWLAGQPIGLRLMQAQPDRWGRMIGLAQSTGPQPPISLTQAVIDAGLGLAQPGQIPRSCLLALYRAESKARQERIGFWADQDFAVLQASDQQSLRDRAGGWVLVEGNILTVNETKFRTYLNMGPRRGTDLALVIAKANLKLFQQKGLAPQALVGKRLRVHGLVALRPGPLIEISGPDAIETLK